MDIKKKEQGEALIEKFNKAMWLSAICEEGIFVCVIELQIVLKCLNVLKIYF